MLRTWITDLFDTTEQFAFLALALSALGSILVYVVFFTNTANLLVYLHSHDMDLLALLRFDPLAQWRLLLGFAALAGLYLVGWRAAQKLVHPSQEAWIILIGGAVLAGFILLYLYPIDAADIFDNIMHGRIQSVYGGNPFRNLAIEYSQDPFFANTAWRTSPSAYGPAWELLAAIATRLIGNGLFANIIVFKLIPGFFHLALVGLVALILRKIAPERALAGAWLVAWNPVGLYETFGNGHNDVIMAFWITAAVLMLILGRHTRTVLALVVGGLFKYISILLIPVAVMIALRSLTTWKERFRYLIITSLFSAGISAFFFAPFWRGLATLSIKRRENMFTSSLPSIFFQLISQHVPADVAGLWISRVAAGITILFVIWKAWRASRPIVPGDHRANQPIAWLQFTQASLAILIFYLLVTCLWFNPWYCVWLLGMAALLPPSLLQGLVYWITFTCLSKTLLGGPLIFLQKPLDPLPWLELRLTTSVVALPWVGSWWVMWQTHKLRRHEQLQDHSPSPAKTRKVHV